MNRNEKNRFDSINQSLFPISISRVVLALFRIPSQHLTVLLFVAKIEYSSTSIQMVRVHHGISQSIASLFQPMESIASHLLQNPTKS